MLGETLRIAQGLIMLNDRPEDNSQQLSHNEGTHRRIARPACIRQHSKHMHTGAQTVLLTQSVTSIRCREWLHSQLRTASHSSNQTLAASRHAFQACVTRSRLAVAQATMGANTAAQTTPADHKQGDVSLVVL